jgi:putative DNA primase/helicase
MRQDFFEFTPQFKLIIAGNHKPGLRSVNEAIRRRFYLVPFTVTIPPEDRDRELAEKLKAEWPGILAWMIEGCRSWQVHGLDPPEAVTEATAAYLEAEDAMGAWIEECCERDTQAWTKRTELFDSWRGWAEGSGEWAGSIKQFAQKLEDRGLRFQKRHGERGYWGLRLGESAARNEANFQPPMPF